MSEYIITDEQIAENQRLKGKKLLVMPVVVRCRDCKWFIPGFTEYRADDWCQKHDHIGWSYNGFCSWGERRDAE